MGLLRHLSMLVIIYFVIYSATDLARLVFLTLYLRITDLGNSLVVQWVGLRAPIAGGLGSIPGRGTRSCMHAATKTQCSPNK